MGTILDTEVISGNRKGKPNYPADFKRRLAIAASDPGVSVSKLALEHQLNTNMVFKWRRELRAGLLDIEPQGPASTSRAFTTANGVSHASAMFRPWPFAENFRKQPRAA
jgi:transposase